MKATKQIDALIAQAKAYAEQNYSNGMDTFVECYTDEEWLEIVCQSDLSPHPGALRTWEQVKEVMDACADVWRDRQAEAEYQRRAMS